MLRPFSNLIWRSDEVHVFFLLESPFLGSRLELLRKVLISYEVSSKSVKTTRPYHISVVLKRKRVDWHCYKDQ